ncbi:hypothetical protein H310_05577 [Aphanomyces invadans]|uniref:ParB-like N-terminal domain-containing protein n=1 Tax=Aphanomyces invadans TaxID=157072 RepID=A0A024UBY5_9STRA|nr:hypothetical protein H310_05577 [Aphanomyces invadans]ETW03158.1 hypothetical protein H310_05577 [Aphanomyces invadans]|eukprot:XP_008868542.1 hypothetical protein H310_05577 [Aphanomyces invadans]
MEVRTISPMTRERRASSSTVPTKRQKNVHDDNGNTVEAIEVPRRRKRDVLKQVSMRLFLSAQGYTTDVLRNIFNQAEEVETASPVSVTEASSTEWKPRKHLWLPKTQDDANINLTHENGGSSSDKKHFLLSRFTDPTSYFYKYHDAHIAPRKAVVVLVSLSWLKPHEEIVSWERVHGLKNATLKWDAYTEPLLVDIKTGAILDGHHRYTVGLQLDLKQLPCVLIDYLGDDFITVDVWPDCGRSSLTKQQVIDMAMSPNVFPPKTSRHRFTESLPPISIPLSALRVEPTEGTLGYECPAVQLAHTEVASLPDPVPSTNSVVAMPPRRFSKRQFVLQTSLALLGGASDLATTVVRSLFRHRIREIERRPSHGATTLDLVTRPAKKDPNRSVAFDAIRANDPTSSFSRIKGRMAQTLEDIMDSGNTYRKFFASRITDPTSYFYKYRLEAEKERSPKRQKVVLVLVSWLKAHEAIVSASRVDGLRRATVKWDAYLEPLLVDRKTGAILDGHHRYTVAVQLGLLTVPAVLVDYLEDNSITVDVWPECGRDSLTKEEVIAMALSDDVFPPKTSRHAFSDNLPPIKIALDKLRQPYFTDAQ